MKLTWSVRSFHHLREHRAKQQQQRTTEANFWRFFSQPDPDKGGSCSPWKWFLPPLPQWRMFLTRNIRDIKRLSISQKNLAKMLNESLTDSDVSLENHQAGFTELQTLTGFLCINWRYSPVQHKARPSKGLSWILSYLREDSFSRIDQIKLLEYWDSSRPCGCGSQWERMVSQWENCYN